MSIIEKEYICIACPIGCRLLLTDDGGVTAVSGNKCRRGEIYATEEYSEPKRVVTATCSIGLENLERLPVKTDKPILKDYIDSLLKTIYELRPEPPVRRGDVLIENFKNTGVDVIASRSAG